MGSESACALLLTALRPSENCKLIWTEATDCMLIFSERHAGLGVCAWKAHGSCGLVHGVYKDRKCSFLYGV